MARQKPILAAETFLDMSFPVNGVDVSRAFGQQRRSTSPEGVNVRTYEPSSNRGRGGARPGLSRYINAQPGGTALIQELFTLVGVGYTPPGGSTQTSSSGRVVTLVAVSGGNIYVASPQDTAWTSPTNNTGNTPPLNSSGVVRSASNGQLLYFAEGTHWVYYNPATNAIETWAASAGSLPVDGSSNKPRLIVTWRGRTVVSGLLLDGHNWFMSKVGDATNFDYAPATPSPDQAIAGNASPLGKIGDIVTALIPYTDDILYVGGDHTIWMFSGDPMAGGQISLVSDAIGMAFGAPWCKGPDGTLYFVSNRTGIYAIPPGQPPQRISQQIESLVNVFDTGLYTIRLIWDDRFQGLHVFITKTSGQAAASHLFWEQRAGAWWVDQFASNAHNPLCVTVFDGNEASDRRPLIGSWDGYVRSIDPDALDDDGTAIASSVVIGPINSKELDMFLCKDLQAVLGETSGNVTYAVHVGDTAEAALSSTAVATGTWGAGRNLNTLVRRSGHAIYVKLTATAPWAFENCRARIAGKGKVQRRGY